MKEVDVQSIKTSGFQYGSFEFEIAANCDVRDHPKSHEIAVKFDCRLIPNSVFYITIVIPDSNKKHMEFELTHPSTDSTTVTTHSTFSVCSYKDLCDVVALITDLLVRIYGPKHEEMDEDNSPYMSMIHTLFFEKIGFRGQGNEPY